MMDRKARLPEGEGTDVFVAATKCHRYRFSLALVVIVAAISLVSNFELVKRVMYERNSNQSSSPRHDPCSNARHPKPGEGDNVGVLYSVAGTEEFAFHAFRPVVNYLRTELGIPDAADRVVDGPKWALATEPHLCRGPLRSIRPFFDTVMTFSELDGGKRNPTLNHNAMTLNGTTHRALQQQLGFVNDEDNSDSQIRHWVRAVKISAMAASPFKTTVYLDVDSIPCQSNFTISLTRALGSADIALQPEEKEGYSIPAEHRSHWINETRGERATDMHNSACVVLNMTSDRTRELLQRTKQVFFSSTTPPKADQPSLGRAFLQMFEAKRQLQHVDLGFPLICSANSWPGDYFKWQMASPKCHAENNECVIIHKMSTWRAAHGTETSQKANKVRVARLDTATLINDPVKGPLFQMLEAAGYRWLHSANINRLPTWEHVAKLYGEGPRIVGLDTCEKFRATIPASERLIAPAGAFNSGTNLLAVLLFNNCELPELREDYDQYLLRYQVNWGKHQPARLRMKVYNNDVITNNSVLMPVVTVRDPYSWMQSLCRNSGAAHFLHSSAHCPNLVPNEFDEALMNNWTSHTSYNDTSEQEKQVYRYWSQVVEDIHETHAIPVDVATEALSTSHDSLVHLWNEWYDEYIQANFPRLFVRMEDLVFHGENVTKTICNCVGGRMRRPKVPDILKGSAAGERMRRRSFRYPRESTRGPKGPDFLEAMIRHGNLNRSKGMTKEDTAFARTVLRQDIMELFGYSHP